LLLAVTEANEYELASDGLWIAPFLVTDNWPAALTVTVTSSLELSRLSFAVSRSTYEPVAEKLAVVSRLRCR
jgi:hypothetical protein